MKVDLSTMSDAELMRCFLDSGPKSEMLRRLAAKDAEIARLSDELAGAAPLEYKVGYEDGERSAAAEIAALRKERGEAVEASRLHVVCMCAHLLDDHDGECQGFGVGGGGQETECDCQNFRPAWAAWWERADSAEREVERLRGEMAKIADLLPSSVTASADDIWRVIHIARAALACGPADRYVTADAYRVEAADREVERLREALSLLVFAIRREHRKLPYSPNVGEALELSDAALAGGQIEETTNG